MTKGWAYIPLSNENWEFILDSLNDRLENLIELESQDNDFTAAVRHAESIIKAIEGKINA